MKKQERKKAYSKEEREREKTYVRARFWPDVIIVAT